ncbi:MAG TPA: DUF1015 domain-containing protein [Coriobacteriia bacterium]|nr:DUF1015 domain-containing protein [Coriobacteriia bacterium]
MPGFVNSRRERIPVARLRPFKAYAYARTSADVSHLVAPPYDVVSDQQRAALLARDARNVVALELPEGSLDPSAPQNRYVTGRLRWRSWRDSGVVVKDRVPALYILEQHFRFGDREHRRRALIGEVELRAFDENVILPHEQTLPKALGDRYNLTRACAANFSQVFGLYSDPAHVADRHIAYAISGRPTMTATGDDGVVSTVWTLADPAAIAEIADSLSDTQVFIADGHHRYTTALAYRDERRRAAGRQPGSEHTPDPPYDFVMMALVNMDDPGLVVLPTHRIASVAPSFDAQALVGALAETFDLRDVPPHAPVDEALATLETPGFVVVVPGRPAPILASVPATADLDALMPIARSLAWKTLDVSLVQELVLARALGIHPDRPETLDRLSFVKDAEAATASVADGRHVAFLVRPVEMEQMRAVALAGETMPQKTTYFYPKLLSGLLMRGMD